MSLHQFKYFIFNKPFGVLSQFSGSEGRKTIKDFFTPAKDVYPVGRLDMDSEGLLLLTNDKNLINFLLDPKNKHEREYLVQVEGIPAANDLKKLENGIVIQGEKTLPAKVKKIPDPIIWKRNPPIRERRSIPVSWLDLIIVEGKNRQIRRMTAKIGYPALRLIRIRIKNIPLGELRTGEIRELSDKEARSLKMPAQSPNEGIGY
jgi:23S rRNA pseudouridine2457 synthase